MRSTAEIRGLLSAAPDEVLANELDSSYLPEAHGWSLREWLTELKRRLEQGISRD